MPMNSGKFENVIYHHINAGAAEYVEKNKADYPDTTLYESLDHEFTTFIQDLEQRFREEIKPRFGRV